jgi:hypothetical protein
MKNETIKRSELRRIHQTEVPPEEVKRLLGDPPIHHGITLTPTNAQVIARGIKVQEAAAGKEIEEDLVSETLGKIYVKGIGWILKR